MVWGFRSSRIAFQGHHRRPSRGRCLSFGLRVNRDLLRCQTASRARSSFYELSAGCRDGGDIRISTGKRMELRFQQWRGIIASASSRLVSGRDKRLCDRRRLAEFGSARFYKSDRLNGHRCNRERLLSAVFELSSTPTGLELGFDRKERRVRPRRMLCSVNRRSLGSVSGFCVSLS